MPEHHDTGEEEGGGVGESLSVGSLSLWSAKTGEREGKEWDEPSDIGRGAVNGLEDGGVAADLFDAKDVSERMEGRVQESARFRRG